VLVTVDDKIQSITHCELRQLLQLHDMKVVIALWMYIQYWMSYRCNPHVGVSCMWPFWECRSTCDRGRPPYLRV